MKTLKSNRLHIGIFGKTNVGKSSFLNKITNQEVSITSEIAGTTTDIVEKSMELFPIGAVNFIDTAGLDDNTELGDKRIEKTLNTLPRIDVATLIIDSDGFSELEKELITKFNELNIPYLVVINKFDINQIETDKYNKILDYTNNIIETSATSDENILDKYIESLIKILPEDFINPPSIIGDKINKTDNVILVTPIDKEAPKGRLILPQVQTIRDLLDNNCIVTVVQENNLKTALENLKTKPALVITDSQAFKEVNEIIPDDIPLTSFSIIFARLKGDLKTFYQGALSIKNLKENDKVLLLESCTHHTIEDDIAREKIPKLLEKKLGVKLDFEYKSGHEFPPISGYKLIIHCGACMTNKKEVLSRILLSQKRNVPITNYGMAISYCLNILDRATQIFKPEIE